MDLVPAAASSSGFSQQGSVDWVALSNRTLSFSTAVLARLSAAGLEPLTIAVAQHMCLRMPIGVRGEKRLQEAMSSLKSFSPLADVLWIGVGVRHILRALVQTSQGASIVALAASLAEGHSPSVSAHVLYDLAGLMGSPEDVSPSLTQWRSFVELCSGILSASAFGPRMNQMLRLCDFEIDRSDLQFFGLRSASPKDIAEVLREIGALQTGHSEALDITGGAECCWIIVFCDYVLGLRVRLIDGAGNTLYANYNLGSDRAQIQYGSRSMNLKLRLTDTCRFFLDSEYLARLSITHRTFVLNSRYLVKESTWDTFALGSRVEWDDIVGSCSRRVKKHLFKPSNCEDFGTLLGIGALYQYSHALRSARDPDNNTAFRVNSPESFIESAVARLPELCPLEIPALRYLRHALGSPHTRKQPWPVDAPVNAGYEGAFFRYVESVDSDTSKWCTVSPRLDRSDTMQKYSSGLQRRKVYEILSQYSFAEYHRLASDICCRKSISRKAVNVFAVILSLAYLTNNLVLDDSLTPSRVGLELLIRRLGKFSNNNWLSDISQLIPLSPMNGTISPTETPTSAYHHLFDEYIKLFSGSNEAHVKAAWHEKVSAVAARGLYCYVQVLQSPDQLHAASSKVHVGRGWIQFHDRLYDKIVSEDEGHMVNWRLPNTREELSREEWKVMAADDITLRLGLSRYESRVQVGHSNLSRLWNMAGVQAKNSPHTKLRTSEIAGAPKGTSSKMHTCVQIHPWINTQGRYRQLNRNQSSSNNPIDRLRSCVFGGHNLLSKSSSRSCSDMSDISPLIQRRILTVQS